MEHYKLVGVEWAQVFEKEMLGKKVRRRRA